MTLDTTLSEIRTKVLSGEPIPPPQYLDWAVKLNVLLLDLDDELVQKELAVSQKLVEALADDKLPVNRARAFVKTLPEYVDLQHLRNRRRCAEEVIRLGKKRVELKWNANLS